MNIETVVYKRIEELELKLDFHRAEGRRKERTIIYIHGGGLIYGSRKDLPKEYINSFLEAGYDFVTLDYPFHPETEIPEILDCVEEAVLWFIHHGVGTFRLKRADYILFGRSSGAYLAAQSVKRVTPKPESVILLYGYYDLTDDELTGANAYYLSHPLISRALADKLTLDHPVSEISPERRFMLYMHMRQTGTWLASEESDSSLLSLNQSDFSNFPRTFLSFSKSDHDVPCNQSRNMAKYIPEVELFEVDHKEHDFDRDPSREVSKDLYARILKWLIMNEEILL